MLQQSSTIGQMFWGTSVMSAKVWIVWRPEGYGDSWDTPTIAWTSVKDWPEDEETTAREIVDEIDVENQNPDDPMVDAALDYWRRVYKVGTYATND